jgi:hypothetical protein
MDVSRQDLTNSENVDPNRRSKKPAAEEFGSLVPFYAALEAGKKVCTCGAAKIYERERAHLRRFSEETRAKHEAAVLQRQQALEIERDWQARLAQVRSKEAQLAGEESRLAEKAKTVAEAQALLEKREEKLRRDRTDLDIRILEVDHQASQLNSKLPDLEHRESVMREKVRMHEEIAEELLKREATVQQEAAALETARQSLAREKDRVAERSAALAERESAETDRIKDLTQREADVAKLEVDLCNERKSWQVDENAIGAQRQVNEELKSFFEQKSKDLEAREKKLKDEADAFKARCAADGEETARSVETQVAALQEQKEAVEVAAADLAAFLSQEADRVATARFEAEGEAVLRRQHVENVRRAEAMQHSEEECGARMRILLQREHDIEERYRYVEENGPLIARYKEMERELELRQTALDLQEDSFAKTKEVCESRLEDRQREIEHLGTTLREQSLLQKDRARKLAQKEKVLEQRPFNGARHPSLK